MNHREGGSRRGSECTLLITVGYTDDVVAPVRRSTPSDPICKRLASSQIRPEEQVRLIKNMLADRGEQQAAKDLEPGDALKLVEFLDLVRLFVLPQSPAPYGEQILRTGRLDASIRPTCIRYSAQVCGWHRLLPDSVQISGHERESTHSGGGHSQVWNGRYNGRKVAIKVLNIYGGDDPAKKKEIAKVGHLATVLMTP